MTINCPKFKLAIAVCIVLITAQTAKSQVVEKTPRLVVNILLKDFQTNQLATFYDRLSENGIKKIMKDGTYYPNATFDHLATYEGGNIATLVTGTQPSVHGLIGNSWYNPVKGNQEWALGLDVNDIKEGDNLCRLTTRQILCSTVSDELRLVNSQQSKIASIGVDLTEALIAGGHSAQSIFWLDKSCNMVSNICAPDTIPKWAKDYNAKKFADMYAARWWGPLYDLNSYHEYIAPSKIGGANSGRTFLYNLSQQGAGGKLASNIKGSPYINMMIRDFAVSLMVGENFGKDAITDMVTIAFATKPRMRANVSILDAETEDMVLRLDKDIETLLTFLNEWVGKDKYLITMTSTGGSAIEPKELDAYNIPTGVFSGRKATSLLSLYLMALHGQNRWIKNYQDGNFYLDKELIEKSNLNFEEMKAKSAKFLMQVSGVSMAMTNTELISGSYTDGVKLKIQQSFHQTRSGDILIALQPGWVEEFEIKGSDVVRFASNDQRVPLCLYGWGVKKQEITTPISLTSLAPTLSLLLKINIPNGCQMSGLYEISSK